MHEIKVLTAQNRVHHVCGHRGTGGLEKKSQIKLHHGSQGPLTTIVFKFIMNPVAKQIVSIVQLRLTGGIITGSDRRGHGLGCMAVVIRALAPSHMDISQSSVLIVAVVVLLETPTLQRTGYDGARRQENSQQEEEDGGPINWPVSFTARM